MQARLNWLTNSAVILLATATALILVEVATRVFTATVKPNVMVLDPQLGWVHRPNTRRIYSIDGNPAVVETNELGLRGPAYVGASSHTRVMVLGDSFVDGLEVSNDELFSTIWDEQRPDLEIVNAGVGGYGTVQETKLTERLEPIIQPHLYLLMVYVNDLTDNVMPFYGGIGPRPYADEFARVQEITWDQFDPLLLPLPGARWLHQNSLAAYLIRNRLLVTASGRDKHRYIERWRSTFPEPVKWRVLRQLVKQIADGRELVIVALPTREQVAANDSSFTRRVGELADNLGLQFVDLQMTLRKEHFFTTDIHWNAAGHRAVADHLTSTIVPRTPTAGATEHSSYQSARPPWVARFDSNNNQD